MSNQVVVLSEYRRLRWDGAVEAFLAAKQLSPATRRTYRLALDAVGHQIGSDIPLDEIHPEQLFGSVPRPLGRQHSKYVEHPPSSRSGPSCRSAGSGDWIDRDPLALVGRRRPPRDRTSKAIPVSALETLVEPDEICTCEKKPCGASYMRPPHGQQKSST